ncbi:proline--tRNA ligase [Companilactobacillus furfuricola]|uniref:proline--tRNA ligase n=1 Tax=Companilactobacillus furfuricola TaxID=1462575 RepID=UPI000F7A46C8|nr:proline--tRNA ligase [Companilactobacillus furfuricola]
MSDLQKENFSEWYLTAIKNADLMSYSPVRGCIIFKPDGYSLWESIQAEFNKYLATQKIRNAYFPLLIPKHFFEKEEEHIEGFAPELPWMTQVGDQKLDEPYALRPTSETMIGNAFSDWINSYRDLPYEINQWANVFRWEKKTLPFLRTSEFLWQEGHTAHATEEDARKRTLSVLDAYEDLIVNFLAIPSYKGQKTPSERFAGAVDTYSIETMMRDGKAVQAGTSHYLGQNFAKSFDIKFLDKDDTHKYVYTTSWGISTRLIGATIMVHGDEKGIVLPPKIAPTQVVLIPVGPWQKNPEIMETLQKIQTNLEAKNIRVEIDDSDNTPGYKFNEWEQKGVPMHVELGPRDIKNSSAVIKMRDLDDKDSVALDGIEDKISQELDTMQTKLLESAKARNKANEHYDIDTLDDFKKHIATCKENNEVPGFVLIGWDGTDETEAKIKEETGFTTRNIPFNPPMEKKVDIVSGKPAKYTVWIARAY